MFRKILAIAILSVVGAGVGFQATQMLPTKWAGHAQFEQPKVTELGNYFTLYSTYNLVSGNAAATDVSLLEEKVASESYVLFKRLATSESELLNVLAQSDIAKEKARIEQKNVTVVAQELSKQFSFGAVNGTDTLNIIADNATDAEKLLGTFIRNLNQKAKESLYADLTAKWQTLYQQVKTAAEAKIDKTWENKLNMLKNVKPLDNQLVTFRFVRMPNVIHLPHDPIKWIGGGAGIGFLLGVLMVLLLGNGRKAQNENA